MFGFCDILLLEFGELRVLVFSESWMQMCRLYRRSLRSDLLAWRRALRAQVEAKFALLVHENSLVPSSYVACLPSTHFAHRHAAQTHEKRLSPVASLK